MKKFLLFFVSLLTCVGLHAQEVTIDFSQYYTATTDLPSNPITLDGVTVSFEKGTGKNAPYYQSARKRVYMDKGTTMTISSSVGNLQSIVFTLQAAAASDQSVSTGTITGAKEKTNTWTPDADNATNEVTLTVTTSSYTPKSMVVTVAGAESKKVATLKFSETSVSINKETDEFTAPTFTYDTDGALTFTSSDENVATVNSEGIISLAGGSGKATITASSPETDNYYAGEATVTIEVYKYHIYTQTAQVKSGSDYLIVGKQEIAGSDMTFYAKLATSSSALLYCVTQDGFLDTLKVKDYEDLYTFTFTEESEGQYSIKQGDGTYLFHFGTATSLSPSDTPTTLWTVAAQADSTFQIYDKNGYYLVTAGNTFTCKNTTEGQHLPYLYTKDKPTKPFEYAFTPADSSVIDATGDIKLWLSLNDAVSYTGVKFTYTDLTDAQKSVEVAKADITEESDGEDGLTLTIPTPEDVKAGKALNLTVSLLGQKNIDGTERDTLAAHYNLMSLQLVAPAIDKSLDKLAATDLVKVQLPAALEDRIGVVYYQIGNATTGESLHTGYMNAALESKLEGGLWATELLQDLTFYEDNDYYITAKAYCEDAKISQKTPVASDSVAFAGSTVVPVELGFTPASGSAVDSLATILISGKDIVKAEAATANSLTLVDADNTVVAYAASIASVAADTVAVKLSATVKAPGKYTLKVPAGTFVIEGSKANTEAEAKYVIYDGTPLTAQVITPDTTSADGKKEVVLKELSQIAVTYSEAIKLDTEAGQIFVVERPRTTYDYTTSVADDGKTLLISLDKAIEAGDNYKYLTVEIPEGYVLSAEGDKPAARLICYFTVGNETTAEQVVNATPASGTTVTSLKEITLAFPNETYANAGFDTDILGSVTNAEGETVATFNCYRFDMGDNYNELKFSLREAITAAGTYTLTFPAGIIQFGEQADRDCKEFTLTYTVASTTGISGTVASQPVRATVYTLGGKKAVSPVKGLYIIGGKKVVVK